MMPEHRIEPAPRPLRLCGKNEAAMIHRGDAEHAEKRSFPFCILHLAALWPSWQWYLARVADPSDEPWGVLAALSAGLLLVLQRGAVRYVPNLSAAALLLLYAAAVLFLPPLLAAAVGVLSLACSIQFERGSIYAVRGLLLLSLPILPSLQFYLGYPIRLATAILVGAALDVSGFPVSREGVLFRFNDQLIWIDAPCSGVKMLWALSYITLCLIALYDLRPLLGIVVSAAASAAAFLANCFRSAALLFVESGTIVLPHHAHEAIGLAAFAAAAYQILLIVRYTARKVPKANQVNPVRVEFGPRIARSALLTAVGCALVLPLFNRAEPEGVAFTKAEWPSELDGRPLKRSALTPKEAYFAKSFPGEIARFRAGEAEVIGRYVIRPTRMLHPSSDCLKGLGYSITPVDAEKGSNGALRSCVIAAKEGETLRVCEFIKAADNSSFADVSSWFWSALIGRTKGPWIAYTVARREV